MMVEFAVIFFILVAMVGISAGLIGCVKAGKLLKKLGHENDTLLRELKQTKKSSLHNVRAAREERNASQRSVDSLSVELGKIVKQNDSLVRRIADLEETGGASQRSVDSLSAELKKVRARENTLLRRVKNMQALQEKLGNSLEIIYTDLKLREES